MTLHFPGRTQLPIERGRENFLIKGVRPDGLPEYAAGRTAVTQFAAHMDRRQR